MTKQQRACLDRREEMWRSMADPTTIAAILADLTVPPSRWRAPVLIGVFGLPGTGKTETARYLAQRFPLVALSTDAIRLRYQLPSGPATHDAMYGVAATLLSRQVAVLVDGIHLGRRDRLRLRQVAAQHGAQSALIFTTARPAVVEARLQARQRDQEQTVAEGKFVITPGHFARIASYLELPTADEAVWYVDTSDGDLGARLATFERWLSTYLTASNQ